MTYALKFGVDKREFVNGLNAVQQQSRATGKYIEASFNTLKMRPFKDVDKDILRLKTAFTALKNSGKLSIGELAKAEAQLKAQTRALKAETQGWTTQMGQAKAGLLALAGGVYAAGKAFSSYSGFGQKMAEVNTLLDVSQDKFADYSAKILDMTGTLPMAASDLAAAEYDIISAGVALGDSTDVLKLAAQAATAGVTDTQTAVNAGLGVINAYGQGVDKLDETYDILFQTVKLGVTTFPALSQSIGDVLPIARSAGVDFKAVGAAIATMTKAGIKTPRAVTALKGALTALSSPTAEVKKEMDALGITWDGLDGTIRQFAQANLGPEALRKLVPDVEARTAVLALSQNYDTLKDTLGSMDEATDSMSAAYDKMKDTPANQIQLFKNEVNQLKIGLGEVLAEGILPAAQGLTSLVNGYQAAGPVAQGFTNTLLLGVTGLSAWHLGLGKVYGALKLARASMLTTTKAFAGFNTLLSVALPIAVGVAVFQLRRLALEWHKLEKEEEKAEEALTLQIELMDKQREKLSAIASELGISISSMTEYNDLMKVGAIVRDEATGKLKLNYNAYIRYHAGLLKVEDAEKKVSAAVGKTGEELVAAAKKQNAAQIELDKFIDGLPKASDGIESYALKVADLKLSLAQNKISQEEFNKQMLVLNKQHWEDEVKILTAAMEKTKEKLDKGKATLADYETAILKVKEAQTELAGAEDALTEKKKSSVDRLKEIIEGYKKLSKTYNDTAAAADNVAGKGGNAETVLLDAAKKVQGGADLSEDAWKSLAEAVGLTVEQAKAAVNDIIGEIDKGQKKVNAWQAKVEAWNKKVQEEKEKAAAPRASRTRFSASAEAVLQGFEGADETKLRAEIKRQQDIVYSMSQGVSPEQKKKAQEVINGLNELLAAPAKAAEIGLQARGVCAGLDDC